MTIRRFLAVMLAIGLVTAVCPTSAAFAEEKEIVLDPDPGSFPGAEIALLQQPLVRAGEAILRLDPEKQGLGGIRLRVEDRAMDIYWKGEVPGGVFEQVVKLEEQGYRAFVHDSRYSGSELARAQEQIIQRYDAYPGLATVSPLPDGSGLRIGFYKGSRPPREWPVAAQIVAESEMTFVDRTNDTPPFWVGGVARNGTTRCSTGFAVWRRNWFTTTEGILTAHHCNRGGGAIFTNGTGTRTIGVAEIPSPATASFFSESLYIPTNSQPRVFDGPPSGSSSTKPVVGRSSNFIGQAICTSGASTGRNCAIRVDLISTTALVRNGPNSFERIDQLVFATEVFGGVAAGSGDSGGPVFSFFNGFSDVLANGSISFVQTPVTCVFPGSLVCGNRVAFVDITWVLRAQQAEVMNTDMVL